MDNVNYRYQFNEDPETIKPIGEKKALIYGDPFSIGYERVSEDHSKTPKTHPYIEGAWMNKFQGKYYLQYAIEQ